MCTLLPGHTTQSHSLLLDNHVSPIVCKSGMTSTVLKSAANELLMSLMYSLVFVTIMSQRCGENRWREQIVEELSGSFTTRDMLCTTNTIIEFGN